VPQACYNCLFRVNGVSGVGGDHEQDQDRSRIWTGAVPVIEQFLKSQGANFGSYRQQFKDFEALVNSINPRWGGGIPATFLYDRGGRLVESWQGATTYAEFESALKPLLP
jgi:hypothetical protein